ncbi:glycosyltransferase domain-containing protein [Chitinophagaceae bacterium MMS25-I14]
MITMTTPRLEVINTLFNTAPAIIHAHGSHDHKPNWLPIKNAFFDLPAGKAPMSERVTVITCNNGHHAMGVLERSLEHLGIPYLVFGQGVHPWVNAVHKPRVLYEALQTIQTPYIIYADSRDAIIINDPESIIDTFLEQFSCKMLFGADRINWPPIPAFRDYEDKLAESYNSEFRYFNGGVWIGETAFSRDFFRLAMDTPPEEKAPESEQGILKKLLPHFEREVVLDYHCKIVQNIGFVTDPIFDIRVKEPATTEKV